MTERVIRVVLDPSGVQSGAKTTEGALRGIDRSTRRTSQSLQSLARAARVAVGFLGVREIVRYADSWTLAGNRIRLATESSAEFNAVQREIIDLANETRSSIDSTVELYSRSERATRDLGLAQSEVLDLTRLVNQSLQISGASAAEAAGSTVQFAQGLGAGALRGEELNSVLEQNSRLANALADGLGVGVGQLKSLGEQGALTAEVILDALREQAPQIQDEFDQLNVSIGSAFTVLGNSAQEFFGRLGEGTGATNALAESIIDVAGFIRGDLLSGINTFIDSFTIAADSAVTNLDTVQDAIDVLGINSGEVFDAIGNALVRLPINLATAIKIAATEVGGFFERAETRIKQFINTGDGVIFTILGNEAGIEQTIARAAELRGELELENNGIIETRNFLTEESLRLEEELQRKIDERAEANLSSTSFDLSVPGERSVRSAGSVDEKAIQDQEEFLEALRSTAVELAIQTSLLDEADPALLRYNTAIEAAALGNGAFVEEALELADAINEQAEKLRAAEEAQQAYEDKVDRAEDIIRATRTEQEAYNEALAELQDLFDSGLIDEDVFLRAKDSLDKTSDALETFLDQARRNSLDILGDGLAGALTGDLENVPFELARTLAEIASQILASEIFSILAGLKGQGGILGAIGSFFAGSSPIGGRALGGSVTANEPVLVGEGSGGFGNSPEIFVPQTSGDVFPMEKIVAALGGLGGGGGETTVINQIDPGQFLSTLETNAGSTVLLNVLGKNKPQLRRLLR